MLVNNAVTLSLCRRARAAEGAVRPDGRVVRQGSDRGVAEGAIRIKWARMMSGPGMDLRRVDLLIGSGGVLLHRTPEAAEPMLRAIDIGARTDGWLVPTAGPDLCRYR